MPHRLSAIAVALTLAACSDGFTSPAEVVRLTNVGDDVTVPLVFADSTTVRNPACHGMEPFATPEMLAKIPGCRH